MEEALEADRKAWIAEILDFLANRNSASFTQGDFDGAPDIALMLSRRNWDQILSENVLGSPAFHENVSRLQELAPREILQDRTHRLHTGIGKIRGRILASATMKQRLLRRNPVLWVSKESSKIWQTPANAAVAGFFHSLLRNAKTASASQAAAVHNGMSLVSHLVRSEPLRHVDPDMNWRAFAFPAHLSTKSEFYRTCSTWMRHYRAASKTRDANELRTVLLGGWLVSEKDERLLELFALSVTLKALRKLMDWESFELTATSRVDGSTQILASSVGVSVRVDFDKSPTVRGKYRWILARYANVDGRGRRPDLQITVSNDDQVLTTLVEVKATAPNSPYGRDSVVKVMGYLHDFSDLWARESKPSYTRAILLFKERVGALVENSVRVRSDEILLTDPHSYESDVTELLKWQVEKLASKATEPTVQVLPAEMVDDE